MFTNFGWFIYDIYIGLVYIQAFWRYSVANPLFIDWVPDIMGLPLKNIMKWINFLFEFGCLVAFVNLVGGYFNSPELGTQLFTYWFNTVTWFIPEAIYTIGKISLHVITVIGGVFQTAYENLNLTLILLGMLDALKAILSWGLQCITVYLQNTWSPIPINYPPFPDLYSFIQARLMTGIQTGGDKPLNTSTLPQNVFKFSEPDYKPEKVSDDDKILSKDASIEELKNASIEELKNASIEELINASIEEFKNDNRINNFNEMSEKYLGKLEEITKNKYKELHKAMAFANVLLNVSVDKNLSDEEKEKKTEALLGKELIDILKNKYEEMSEKNNKKKKGGKSRRRYKKLRNITKRKPKKYLTSRISKRMKKMYKNHKKSYKPLK